jgi:hypothetical protein
MPALGLMVYVLFLALILALWEIQIEGKNGWAEKLPCWRNERSSVGGRPLTGYHIFLALFVITFIHITFLFVRWNIIRELFTAGLIIELFLAEDFLWFALNPDYGVRKFRKGEIWWHKAWIGPVPSMYVYLGVPAIIIFMFTFNAV